MWMTSCSMRWICLVTLAVVMLLSASQAFSKMVALGCCKGSAPKPFDDITSCYEQKLRTDCKHHAFQITTGSGKELCLKADLPWLNKLIEAGQLTCPSAISGPQSAEVLAEVLAEVVD